MKEHLPLVHRSKIVEFCKEYERLALCRIVESEIPKHTVKIEIEWAADNRVDIKRVYNSKDVVDLAYKSKAVQKINNEIKQFIKKTVQFGNTHFNESDWLWETVFWSYRPEQGEHFNPKKYNWV